MPYDIFLSHSSGDKASLVRRVRDELVAQGYTVFLDSDVLPSITPAEVSFETAESLRNALRDCQSLVWLVSDNSATSRWMPWELGFFDGRKGSVVIYPCDENAAAYAKGQEYLHIYPLVPLGPERSAWIETHIPKSGGDFASAVERVQARLTDLMHGRLYDSGHQRPFFNQRDEEFTADQGKLIRSELWDYLFDPTIAFSRFNEIVAAYWRLWGVLPTPKRPGAEAGTPWRLDSNN